MMDAVTIPHEPAAADGLALTTEVVDDRRAFLRLEPDWNRLLRAGAAQTPFLTWEWLHSWWTHLGHAGRLNIIVVRQGDEMVAIAPLTTIGLWPRPFSRTRFLGWGQAGSDYLDLLVQPGFERAAANAVARVLAASGHSLILDHLAPGASAAFLRAPLTAAGWSIHESVQDCCPFIPLAGHTWDSYLGSLGPAHRANVRRRLRALEHEFPVAFALVPPHERLATLDRLAWFHERRWMARGGSSAFSTIPLRAFHADASRRMSERGWLRLYALRLDGVTVAAMYGFFYNRRFFFYQHGFDDTYASYSLGLVTMALTIRAALEEGAVEFDLLYGGEPYKRLWASCERPLGQIHAYRPGVEGLVQRQTHRTRRALGRVARRFGWK